MSKTSWERGREEHRRTCALAVLLKCCCEKGKPAGQMLTGISGSHLPASFQKKMIFAMRCEFICLDKGPTAAILPWLKLSPVFLRAPLALSTPHCELQEVICRG